MTDEHYPEIQLSPLIPVDAATRIYAQAGRVHIPDVFPTEVAQCIARSLKNTVPWRLVFNDADVQHELVRGDLQAMSAQAYESLLSAVGLRARTQFQYLYRHYPLFDLYKTETQSRHYLMRVVAFLQSPAFLEFARRITGESSIAVVDAQATLYEGGHFLTRHDDAVHGINRVAAYVLNFTPGWNPDWGGILLFHGKDGCIEGGYSPSYNAINVFRVPQVHAVSLVAPFVHVGRYSISGWLRRADAAPGLLSTPV